MANLKDLAKQIETSKIEDSKAEELKGPNVRTPSLIPSQIYLVKFWKSPEENSDNIWRVMRFVGSGHQEDHSGERTMREQNLRIKDMKKGDYCFFEGIKENKIAPVLAYQADECLVIGSPPIRITFFEVNGVTVQVKPALKPKAKDKLKDKTEVQPGKRKSAKSTSTKAKVETAPEPVIEETPGESVPVAEQVMPEAVADNSERDVYVATEEVEAVEDAIDNNTLEAAEHTGS